VKITVEDQELREKIVEYLALNGTEVDDDTPVSITLPGAGGSPQRCMSGSNLMTAGGKFAPGYDAKLKSALYAIIRDERGKIPVELTPDSPVATGVIGPMGRPADEWTVDEALAVLDQFNWPHPTVKAKPAPKAKADENGEVPEGEAGEASTGASTRAGRKRAAAKAREEAAAAEAEDNDEEADAEDVAAEA
jgi:hypothetical protein